MIELLIISDDMTGALDSGVQLSKNGYRVQVCPLESLFGHKTTDIDVLVIDTETRHLEPEVAAARVHDVVTSPEAKDARVIFKKTDSTLRGNIGAELQAMLDASGRDAVAYLPSYPAAGRTTSGGRLFVDGVGVAQTSFRNDPLDPVTTSSIPVLLSRQTVFPTRVVAVSEDPELPLPPLTISIFDAESNEKLERLAILLRREREHLLFAGCAGFATYLNRVMEPPRSGAGHFLLSSSRRLIVCGSLNPRSLAQLDREESITQYQLESIESISPSLTEEFRVRIDERGTVAVRTTMPGTVRITDGYGVAKRLGRAVAFLLKEIMIDTLIVIGGDTLIEVMRAVGITGLSPVDEIEAGVPVSVASNRSGEQLIIVSKAGGFGHDRVLERIDTYLDGLDR